MPPGCIFFNHFGPHLVAASPNAWSQRNDYSFGRSSNDFQELADSFLANAVPCSAPAGVESTNLPLLGQDPKDGNAVRRPDHREKTGFWQDYSIGRVSRLRRGLRADFVHYDHPIGMDLLQQYQLMRPQTQLFEHSCFSRCDFCRGSGIFHSKIALA